MKSHLTARQKTSPLSFLYLLAMLLLMILECEAVDMVKVTVYPLADEYFEKIYLVEQNNRIFYLNISCRDVNTMSISITPEL